jgi:two-component system NtrC family sensor kinase
VEVNPDGTSGTTRIAPLRVLVIDDEATIRIALRRFFHRLGWKVEEAAHGHAALAMLELDSHQHETPHYDLVVSDLRMPGLNGMELHARLEVENPDVLNRLVFSTGDTASEDAADFLQETTCPVLQKPFELTALKQVVERVLGRDGGATARG